MNDLQKTQLNILKEFDRVCRLHEIPYSLAGGTALGAIRHQGFIPWDDDIDVHLMRHDFKRLEEAWEADADKNLFLQSYKSDPAYPLWYPKIRDSRTTQIETNKKHLNMNHGVYIDLFLFDYIPKNKRLRKIQSFCSVVFTLLSLCSHSDNVKMGAQKKSKKSLRIFKNAVFFVKFLPTKLRVFIQKLLEKTIIFVGSKNPSALTRFWMSSKPFLYECLFKPFFLDDLIYVPFEGEMFPVMRDYESYFLPYYGKSYMELPPEKNRITHHYAYAIDTEKPYTEYVSKSI
jgi:lipopolysaccharide cholinephosphotransferase